MRHRPGGPGVRLGLGTLAAILLIAPAHAAASTVTVNDRTLFVKGAPGETNTIQVGYAAQGPSFVVSDVPGPTAGNGCFDFAQTAVCSASGIRRIKIETRDGSDTILIDDQVPRTPTRIFSASGNDRIRGSRGNDRIEPGTGTDVIEGNAGIDLVSYRERTTPVTVKIGRPGTSGNADDGPVGSRDTVMNDVENIRGGAGPDRLRGNAFNNKILGGLGNDILRGRRGRDLLRGANDNDVIGGGGGPDRLKGALGADFLRGSNGRDRVRGGAGADRLRGGTGNDRLKGGAGADKVSGLPGNDIIGGGPGTDLLLGQQGIDRIFAADGNVELKINCGPGPNRIEFAKLDSRDPRAGSC